MGKEKQMNRKINLSIIEPSEIITEGLSAILKESESFNILPTFMDINSAQEKILSLRPDVIIINPTLLQSYDKTKLAYFTQNYSNVVLIGLIYQYIDPNILHFFNGFIDIRENRNKVASNIKKLFNDNNKELNDNEEYELSSRETDVLVLLAKGMSSKKIATKLNISIHTVNSHRKNITTKTGIKSVAGLAVYAMLRNLVDEK